MLQGCNLKQLEVGLGFFEGDWIVKKGDGSTNTI